MSERVKGRIYDNSRREAAARDTRRAVVDAAHRLFLANGYAGTSLNGVAAEAGVSVQTVYGHLGSKRTLLKEVLDVAIAGDHEPVAIKDRPEVTAIRAEPDPERKLRRYAEMTTAIAARFEPVDRVMRSAAAVDDEIAEQLRAAELGRLGGMREFAQHLSESGALREGLPVEQAAQRLWSLGGVGVFRPLVVEQGWSHHEFATYLGDLLVAALLPKPPTRRRPQPRTD
jgi:AcrR family transcriptional regulator